MRKAFRVSGQKLVRSGASRLGLGGPVAKAVDSNHNNKKKTQCPPLALAPHNIVIAQLLIIIIITVIFLHSTLHSDILLLIFPLSEVPEGGMEASMEGGASDRASSTS